MYITNTMNKNTAFTEQYNKLREQVNPDIHELEHFLKLAQVLLQEHKVKILTLKYLAMTTVPTTIEKTMSPYQLYESNRPLWAVELTARGIERFVIREKYNGKLPKILFNDYYNNAKQGIYFDDNVDFDSLYPASITNLKKGT